MLAAFKERLLLGIEVFVDGLGELRMRADRDGSRGHDLLGVLPGPGNDVLVFQDAEQLQRGAAA